MTKVLLDSSQAGKLLLIDADPVMGLPNALGVTIRRPVGQISGIDRRSALMDHLEVTFGYCYKKTRLPDILRL